MHKELGGSCTERSQGAGAAAQALQLQQHRVEADVHHFTAAIVGFIPAAWSFALQTMQGMAELSVDLDVVACNAALSACGRGQAWTRAMNLLRLSQASLRPDAISFNTVLVNCAWPAALRSTMASLGCQPDRVTQNTEAASWVHRGQWRLALRKLFKKGVSALDMFSLTIATSACEEAKSWSKALGLYALSHLCHARRDKLLPSANAAMSACTSQGCWPVAIEILQHMQRSRCRGDAITLGQCARSFQLGVLWLNALELLEGKGEGVTFLINRLRT